MAKAKEQTQEQTQEEQLNILKLYVENASIEVPNVKTIFAGNWAPELNISVNTKTDNLEEANTYNISLTVKCEVKSNKEVAFIVDVTQCGIFSIPAADEKTMQHVLGVFCPNVLYPYLREVVTDVVMKAGFPQLALAPINFEMMLEQNNQQSKTKQ
jgi:preprotein translocase subunit SecB